MRTSSQSAERLSSVGETEGPQSAALGAGEPERIGKYDVVSCLGKGAMGVVYLARDPFLERDVALKVMLPQISDDPEQKHRFEREARAVARMMHPNVVTIFDLGYHSDGSPYIAMELLRGQDLMQALRDGPPLSLERKLSIIVQVLEGVGHAHRAGIVHRDIKPANTFLNDDGTVKIMDFGVARFTAASMTATGIVVGTANYMAPEQVNGARVDGRADLFSVGCMLYELLLGRRPFEADTLMSTLWKIVHEEAAFNAAPAPELRRLIPVLQRALAKLPDERYQTAAEFAAGLSEAPEEKAPGPVPSAAGARAALPVERAASPTLDLKRAALEATAARTETRSPADPTRLFVLMREIQMGARSGHLHFTHGRERRSLRIVRGGIVHGTSDVPGQHLGDILVRYGLLGQADLEHAIAVVLQDRKRLGSVLAERGIVSPERLSEAVGIHIRDILSDVAGRGDGSFAFEELAHDALPEGQADPSFSIGEMILETARRIQSPEVVRRVLGDRDRVLSLSTHPLLRSQKLTLTPTDGFLRSRIDGTTTASEVFRLIPLPLEDVERSLFTLLCTGTVEFVAAPAQRSASASPPARQRPSLQREAAAELEKFGEAARAAGRRAEAAAHQAEGLQRDDVLRKEILASFEGLANRTHFELLGLPRNCSTVEVEAAFGRLAAQYGPDVRLPASPADLRVKRAGVYTRLTEAHDTLRDRSRRSKYEATLDARDARAQLQPPPPPPRPQATSLHVESVQDGQAVVDGIREAQRLLREERAWDAITLLEPLISRAEGHSRFRAEVTLARAYLKNPKWTKRAEELLHRVVQEAPEHAEAYVVLGNIYRAGQLRSRALAMYGRALALQPGFAEAIDGLASLGPREPAPPESGSLMKKLFGRSTGSG
jgi:predicted Ser/Thr protein kinase/tetratricopeptide (TPR) repeat protein